MLGGFPANNILNYDETNLSDDPGAEKLIFKCGKKYPEHIMNYSKGNTSIMFSGTAAGELLPLYMVYKSRYMWQSWTTGGPKGAWFNRSKVDGLMAYVLATGSELWFFHGQEKKGRKVVIEHNLSSYFSTDVLKLCKDHNIFCVCLAANSTHLSQPLAVAFYGPLRRNYQGLEIEIP